MNWILLTASVALAGPPEPAPDPHYAFVIRGVAETWDDAAIGAVYRTGALSSGFGMLVPVHELITLDFEAAYRRMPATDGSANGQLELLPLSFIGEWIPDGTGGDFDLFVGLGPAFTVFSEKHTGNPGGLLHGTRLTVETRFGGRVNTGLVRPPMAPSPRGLHALELEIYASRRFQRPGSTGFQLGAWRGCLGLAFRL